MRAVLDPPGELSALAFLGQAARFVAMTSERPHRAAFRASEVVGLLIAARERAFDPLVVDAFVAVNAAGDVSTA